jgi:MFS family permease
VHSYEPLLPALEPVRSLENDADDRKALWRPTNNGQLATMLPSQDSQKSSSSSNNDNRWGNDKQHTDGDEDGEHDPTTPFHLLDRAIDDIGTGWVQKELLLVTSFGQFIDAAETSMLGVVLPFLQSEFHATESELALVGSLTAFGMMVGAPLFGRLSDLYGRKRIYQLSLSLCVVFGFISSFMTDIRSFAVMRLFLGLGYGGNMVACTTLLVEYVPARSRGLFMSLSGLAFGFGAIFIVGLAWIAMPTLGWRWIMRIASFLGIPALIGLTFLPESLRFYVMKGEYELAVNGVESLAHRNEKRAPKYFTVARLSTAAKALRERHDVEVAPRSESKDGMWRSDSKGVCERDQVEEIEGVSDPLIPKTSSTSDEPAFDRKASRSKLPQWWMKVYLLLTCNKREVRCDAEAGRVSVWSALSRPYVVRNLVPLLAIWTSTAFAISIFFWVPLEIKAKYRNDPSVPYEIAFTLAVGGMVGSICTVFLTLRFGRLSLLRVSSFANGVALMLLGIVQSEAGLFVVAFVADALGSLLISTLYLYTPEVFPTNIRVTVFGVCQFGFRLAPTIAPFAIAALIDVSFELACVVMGALLLLTSAMTWTLKVVTFNADLVEEDQRTSHTAGVLSKPNPAEISGAHILVPGLSV